MKDPEPFMKLVHQGMILGEDGEKMAKSRGNVVNPDDVVKSHGADALRLYEMFMGPLEAVKPWQTADIEGVGRFLDRVWNVCTGPLPTTVRQGDEGAVHKTMKKVGERHRSVPVQHRHQRDDDPREATSARSRRFRARRPHAARSSSRRSRRTSARRSWERLGTKASLAYEPWPSFDPALVKDDAVEIGVQVNGKVRGSRSLPVDATRRPRWLPRARGERRGAPRGEDGEEDHLRARQKFQRHRRMKAAGAALLIVAACGYHAVYGAEGERLRVVLVRSLVPDAIAADEM